MVVERKGISPNTADTKVAWIHIPKHWGGPHEVRESLQNPVNSGLGIILICLESCFLVDSCGPKGCQFTTYRPEAVEQLRCFVGECTSGARLIWDLVVEIREDSG